MMGMLEDGPAASPLRVTHFCPGGREHGGGIGRMVGNIIDSAQAEHRQGAGHAAAVGHRICDTRGARLTPLGSGLRLLWATALLLRDRLVAPQAIQHFHIAGRGSTWRKLILTTMARGLGARHILHLHDYDYGSDFLARPRWQRQWIRQMFGGADRVVVLGARDRDMAIQLLGVHAAQIEVMHNAVPDPGPRRPQALAAASPANPALGQAPPVNLLFLGRLSARKGVPELLEALASPELQARNWHAVLAGDGPVESYRRQAEARGLLPRLALPGWLDVKGVTKLCRQADILVLPSHAEGLAMALLEGLAHGLVVVTTRVGAHDEVIVDGVSGVFVPVGDPPALASCLAGLIDDAPRRARLAASGRATYRAGFSMEGYMTKLSAIYARLGDAPAAPVVAL